MNSKSVQSSRKTAAPAKKIKSIDPKNYGQNYGTFLEVHCDELGEFAFENSVETLYRKPSGGYVIRVARTTLDGKVLPEGEFLDRLEPQMMNGDASWGKASQEEKAKALEDRFKRISRIETYKEVGKLDALRWFVETSLHDEELKGELLGRLAR